MSAKCSIMKPIYLLLAALSGAACGSTPSGEGRLAHPDSGTNPANAGTSGKDSGADTSGSGGGGGSAGIGGSTTDEDSGGVDAQVNPDLDAAGLSIERQPDGSLCRFSRDGRYLIVRVHNAGPKRAPLTQVEVATANTSYALRLEAQELDPSQSIDLSFDRSPLVGFIEQWAFAIALDPDGEHGPAAAPLAGLCLGHRARAALGMQALSAWYDTPSGLWNGNEWWRGANMLEVTIDYSRHTGDSTYVPLIDNTFVENQSGNFLNEYYDDEGWWALTWIKAYDLTHDVKYLDMAKTIFNDMLIGWQSSHCGGGLYWRKIDLAKNAIPNELFLAIAARLHLRTPGDGGPGSYLDWATREWAWFENSGMIGEDFQIVDGINSTTCVPEGPAYTYNQGVILGGLVDLWQSTGDASLLDTAESIALSAIEHMTTPDGVFIEALCDPDCGEGDGVQFKGIFARNLAYLYVVRPRAEFQEFLIRQSDAIWGQSRNAANQFGKRWAGPFDLADASRQSSALDAIVGAVAAASPNLALYSGATGSTPCSPTEAPVYAADGSARFGSKWCSGGLSGQQMVLDLGLTSHVVGFRMRHAGAGGEDVGLNTRDFAIDVSADEVAWTTSALITDNIDSVTTHPMPGVDVRYVRLRVMQAQTRIDLLAARIYEFEVFGIDL